MHDFWPSTLDILPTNQLMHGWTGSVYRVEDYKVAVAVTTTFEPDDSKRVTGALEIDGRQKSFVDSGAIVDGSLSEIAFDSEQK